MAPLKLAIVGSLAASVSALAPASTPLVSRKLALQEFSVAAASIFGAATLGVQPAEALTQDEKDAIYLEFKAKKERKLDLSRANSYGDSTGGSNLAGSLPEKELFTNLENKAGGRTMKLLAREAPGAKKPVEIKGKREVKKDMKSLKELAKEGAPVQKYDAGRAPVEESINDKDRKATTRKNNRELSRQLTGK